METSRKESLRFDHISGVGAKFPFPVAGNGTSEVSNPNWHRRNRWATRLHHAEKNARVLLIRRTTAGRRNGCKTFSSVIKENGVGCFHVFEVASLKRVHCEDEEGDVGRELGQM